MAAEKILTHKEISQRGGQANTEAQRLARQENARRAREAKLKKRYGTLQENS